MDCLLSSRLIFLTDEQLSEEVEKLHKLESKGVDSIAEHLNSERGELNDPLVPQNGSDMSSYPAIRYIST